MEHQVPGQISLRPCLLSQHCVSYLHLQLQRGSRIWTVSWWICQRRHALFSLTWRRHTFGVPPGGDFWWSYLQKQGIHQTKLDCWRRVCMALGTPPPIGRRLSRKSCWSSFRSGKIQFLLILPWRISNSMRGSRRWFYSRRPKGQVTMVCRRFEEILDHWYSWYFGPTRNERCRPFHRHSESFGYVDRPKVLNLKQIQDMLLYLSRKLGVKDLKYLHHWLRNVLKKLWIQKNYQRNKQLCTGQHVWDWHTYLKIGLIFWYWERSWPKVLRNQLKLIFKCWREEFGIWDPIQD